MIILVILWTCVGIFVATGVIAVLALIGRIQLETRYKAALFSSLILEVVAVGVGVFSGRIDPVYLEKHIRDSGEADAYQRLSEEIKSVTDRIRLSLDRGDLNSGALELGKLFDKILGQKLAPTADAFYLKGLLAEKRELWSDAAVSYETALQIRPIYLDAMIRAARAKTKVRDYESAMTLYNSADQIARNLADDTTTYRIANGRQNMERRYGAFLLEVGRKDTADVHFTRALLISA